MRRTFSAQRQELTAEVVALQRELERCYLTEKTLRMELEQVSTQLEELKAFFQENLTRRCATPTRRGPVRATPPPTQRRADLIAQVRMKDSVITQKNEEISRAVQREGQLRKELADEQAQRFFVVRDKFNGSAPTSKRCSTSARPRWRLRRPRRPRRDFSRSHGGRVAKVETGRGGGGRGPDASAWLPPPPLLTDTPPRR